MKPDAELQENQARRIEILALASRAKRGSRRWHALRLECEQLRLRAEALLAAKAVR